MGRLSLPKMLWHQIMTIVAELVSSAQLFTDQKKNDVSVNFQ